jgi:hypothetical protein
MTDINMEVKNLLKGPSGPTLRHLDFTGTVRAVDDDTFDIIARKCPNLEFFSFGQDNRYYPADDDVSIHAFSRMIRACPNLKFLRLWHPCGTQGLDPSDPVGTIAQALRKEGFVLKCVPDAAEIKNKIALEDPVHFWRADCEDGLISASWYQRFKNEVEENEFFPRHFCGWK